MTESLLQNLTHILVIFYVGGKSSGIFGEPEAPAQPQRPIPPGGPTSNIFGAPESAPVQSPSRSHPNKPKVGHASRFYSPLKFYFYFFILFIFSLLLISSSASEFLKA